MLRRTLAISLLLALWLLPARLSVVHAADPNPVLQVSVAGPPTYITAADAPGVLVRAIGLHADYNPAVTPMLQLYEVVRVIIHNGSSVPFSYGPSDFTLENAVTHVIYPADFTDATISDTRLQPGTLAPGASVEGDISFLVGFYDYPFILHWSHSPFDVPLGC